MIPCQGLGKRGRFWMMGPRRLQFIVPVNGSVWRISSRRWNSTSSEYEEFKPKIGLEIHAQLGSATKLFSDATAGESAAMTSNSLVSAFDMALPGTLPRLNRKSVQQCILAAVLLNCEISKVCRFDRKHYFYPDLPLGYQITQKTCPIARNGYLDIFSQNEISSTDFYKKRVSIEQLQLEIDSGKTIRQGRFDLIDLNRAGIGLVEIVTTPCLTNAIEATLFVEHLRQLLLHNNVCAGLMHEGHLRIDVNVSVTVENKEGKKTELKNLASLKSLQKGIEHEVERQIAILKAGKKVEEETRALGSQGQTITARAKGSDMDYRFIPEPNLPPLKLDPIWLENARKSAKHEFLYHRCVLEHGFPPLFAFELMNDKLLGDFIREYHSYNKLVPYPHLAAWLKELRNVCKRLSISFPPSDKNLVHLFAELISLNMDKRVTRSVCIELLKDLANKPLDLEDLNQLIEERQLWQITDIGQIRTLVKGVLEDNPKLVEAAKLRPEGRPFVKLRMAVAEGTRKRIDIKDINRIIREHFDTN